MKFILISCIIFTFLSLGYLAYFFMHCLDDDLKSLDGDKKIIKVITSGIFPILSIIILTCDIIYISILYKNPFKILILICSLIVIYTGFYYSFSEAFFFSIFIIIGIVLSCLLLFSNDIKLEEKQVTKSINLYDKSIDRDDLCGVIINITNELFSEKEHYALMQYSENDIKDDKIATSFSCSEFKLINNDDNRLEILHTEVIKCNFFYYHGFTNFKTKTEIIEDSYEKLLYINPENIIYE